MKSRVERIHHIRALLSAVEAGSESYGYYTIRNWREEQLNRPVIRVRSEYLMYRTENSRTIRQQLQYIRNHPGQPKNLFADPESTAAQEAQEDILQDMLAASGKDFIKDLDARGQEEPAIITCDGYLVNGNRRTAALRELGVDYVECVVLPEDATAKEIYEMERDLQISQDFREDYHWINELKNISNGMSRFGYNKDEMARQLRRSKAELTAKLRMMLLVDEFLQWADRKGEYDDPKLDDAEQIFIQLEKAANKYANDSRKQRELQFAIFQLIEEKPAEGRLYDYVRYAIRHWDTIYRQAQISSPVHQHNQHTPDFALTANANSADVLDELIGGEPASVGHIFGDAKQAKTLSPFLVEAIEDAREASRERRDNDAAYESASKALRELQSISLEPSTAKLDSLLNKLTQIIAVATDLQDRITTANS